ncbi:uncharacterized protein LOC133186950 [Saccostrea echinata]|uniref:uncharacterized protein LOC133186950 n=1 Tax=Saccostrea echinata TaxID=191078 RepID=UPI002A7FE227|nr:uncharacterized protein LOC133186950 [Saccostrea echinata]
MDGCLVIRIRFVRWSSNMTDLLRPTESSRMKERTLTDSKISLKKEKSSMSTQSSSKKAGHDAPAGSDVQNGNDITTKSEQQDSVETNDNNNTEPTENNTKLSDKVPADVLQEALALEENDLDEYDPDLFITDEEKKAFDYMLEQKRAAIVQRKENFEKWVDAITRRRMFALSRMRKINLFHGKRNKLYSKFEKFISEVYSENGEISEDNAGDTTPADENGNISNQSDKETGSVTQSKTESDNNRASLLSREDTGFVSRDSEQTPKPAQGQTPLVAPLHS